MNLRFSIPAVAVCVAGFALGGCGVLTAGGEDTPAAAAAPAATATAKPTGTAGTSGTSGMGSVKDAGDLPDPCTLLGRREIIRLTGRSITRIDKDDADANESTRYCQWQQDGGQLALFLSRTTEPDFEVAMSDAEPVDGIGDEAFLLAGHLYVLYGSVQIDVYSYGASDYQNVRDAKEVANVVMPRI